MNKFHFDAAKHLAFFIYPNVSRRALVDGLPVNYTAAHDSDGNTWVIGDTESDLPNPDKYINGCPAKQVFQCLVCGADTDLNKSDMETCDQVCSEECSNKLKTV